MQGVIERVGLSGRGSGWFWGATNDPHPQSQPPPSPQNPTTSLTSSFSNSLELFSPTPTNSTSKDKWPSPPPLPQRSPRIRRRHNLRNYTSLVSTNRNFEVCSSVGAPPPNTSAIKSNIKVHEKTNYVLLVGKPENEAIDSQYFMYTHQQVLDSFLYLHSSAAVEPPPPPPPSFLDLQKEH